MLYAFRKILSNYSNHSEVKFFPFKKSSKMPQPLPLNRNWFAFFSSACSNQQTSEHVFAFSKMLDQLECQTTKTTTLPGDMSTKALKSAFSGSSSLNVLNLIHKLNISSTKCSPSGKPHFMSSRFTNVLWPSRKIVFDSASTNWACTTQAT